MIDKNVVQKDFNCVNDFSRVNDFLIETYRLYNKLHNWDIARWTFNRYCIHGPEEIANSRPWENHVQIWEAGNRNIVGIAHIEEPGDYFFQVHPHYTYLEEDMLKWAINDTKDKLSLTAFSSDMNRKILYEKYHAIKHESTDSAKVLTLDKELIPVSLPDQFEIISLDSEDKESCEKLSNLYTCIWPTSRYMPDGETVNSLTASPIYRKDLTFIARESSGCFAAYCMVWLDSNNRVGHFYPIGTDPDYLGLNLNQAIMVSAINALKTYNCKEAIICGYYEPDDVELFKRLGFQESECEEYFEIWCDNIKRDENNPPFRWVVSI